MNIRLIHFTTYLLFSATMGLCQTYRPDVTLPINENKEVLFGEEITDPYRILESREDPIVESWYQAQSEHTNKVLSQIPGRDSLAAYISELQTSANVRSSLPEEADNTLFFVRTYVKEGYDVLVGRDLVSEEDKILFSTRSLLEKDSTEYTIDFFDPSPDGTMVALGISSPNTEVTTVRVYSVREGMLISDTVGKVTGTQIQWLPDQSGFVYTQMGNSIKPEDHFRNRQVKLRFLGTDAEKDKVLFSKSLIPSLELSEEDIPQAHIFPGTAMLFVSTRTGSRPYASLYAVPLDKVLAEEANWRTVFTSKDQIRRFTVYQNTLLYYTSQSDPSGELIATQWNDIKNQRRVFLSGSKTNKIVSDLTQTRNSFYAKYLKNGISGVVRIDKSSFEVSEVPLPFTGSADIAAGLYSGEAVRWTNGLYFGFYSWNKGYGIYYYGSGTRKVTRTDLRPAGQFENPEGLKVEEVEVASHDGTMVPLSIVYADTLDLDGSNPTILYGYGAYGYSMEPSFDATLLPWFEQGGIYAVAHVRGGGEKGDGWYKGGLKKTKCNSWKDFIACAEYLVKNKYTSNTKLAAQGGSAGGITVGRAVTERPDLFHAAIINVGIMNPLRFEFTRNTVSAPEFGTVKDSSEFTYLREMDPYAHIAEGEAYPAMLLSAAMNDERVEAWQPGKFVARMQRVNDNSIPALLRIDFEGGHFNNDFGAYANELADYYAFLFWQLEHPDFQRIGEN